MVRFSGTVSLGLSDKPKWSERDRIWTKPSRTMVRSSYRTSGFPIFSNTPKGCNCLSNVCRPSSFWHGLRAQTKRVKHGKKTCQNMVGSCHLLHSMRVAASKVWITVIQTFLTYLIPKSICSQKNVKPTGPESPVQMICTGFSGNWFGSLSQGLVNAEPAQSTTWLCVMTSVLFAVGEVAHCRSVVTHIFPRGNCAAVISLKQDQHQMEITVINHETYEIAITLFDKSTNWVDALIADPGHRWRKKLIGIEPSDVLWTNPRVEIKLVSIKMSKRNRICGCSKWMQWNKYKPCVHHQHKRAHLIFPEW